MIDRRMVLCGLALPALCGSASDATQAGLPGVDPVSALAVDDGTLDQTDAFQRLANAISAGAVRGRVTLPAGKIRIVRDVVIRGGNVSLVGSYGATVVQCDKGARLVVDFAALDEIGSPSIEIDGISFRCHGFHTSGLLAVSCGPNSLGSTAEPLMLRNLVFEGVTEFDGFEVGLALNNVPNPIVDHIRFFGDRGNYSRGGVRSGTALKLTSDRQGAGGSGRFNRISAYWLDKVVDISGHQEGHLFSEMIAVCVRHGIAWSAPRGGNPFFVLRDSFLNCTTRCVYAANLVQCDIAGNNFYGEAIPDETSVPVWEGVLLDNIEPHEMMSSVTDNMFLMTVGPAARKIGVHISASPAGGRTSVMIRNRYQGDIEKNTIGIVLDAGTAGAHVSADNIFTGVKQPIRNAGLNTIEYRDQ